MDTKAWVTLGLLLLLLVLGSIVPVWTLAVYGCSWLVFAQYQARRVEREHVEREQAHLAREAPELVGMDFVQRGAYMLKAADEFAVHASEEQKAELAAAVELSRRMFKDKGEAMPEWLIFAMMRIAQKKHGLPYSAPREQRSSGERAK